MLLNVELQPSTVSVYTPHTIMQNNLSLLFQIKILIAKIVTFSSSFPPQKLVTNLEKEN